MAYRDVSFTKAARQRALADALTAQSMQPLQVQQTGTVTPALGIGHGLTQLGQAWFAKKASDRADDMERTATEDDQRRREQLVAQLTADGSSPAAARGEAILDVRTGMPQQNRRGQMLANALRGVQPEQSDGVLAQMAMQQMAPPQEEAYTLKPGEARWRGDQKVAEMPAEEQLTNSLREYEYSRSQGDTRSFPQYMEDMKRAGASSVSVNTGDGRFGKPEVGTWRPNEDKPDVVPIPGGRLAREIEAERQNSIQRIDAFISGADNVIKVAKEAKDMVGNFTSGAGGYFGRKVYGSEATDLEAAVNTIKANLGFDKLNAMRQSSKTGGALGNVSDKELTLLESAVTSLDLRQSPDKLRKNIERVIDHYEKFKAAQERHVAELTGGGRREFTVDAPNGMTIYPDRPSGSAQQRKGGYY